MAYDGEVYVHQAGSRQARAPVGGARRGSERTGGRKESGAAADQVARLEETVARLAEQVARLSELVDQVVAAPQGTARADRSGERRRPEGEADEASIDAAGMKISFFAGNGTTAVVGSPRVIQP